MSEQFQNPNNQAAPTMPSGYLVDFDLRALADRDLSARYGRVSGAEERYTEQANGPAETLLKLIPRDDTNPGANNVRSELRSAHLSEAAAVLSRSSVTDPSAPKTPVGAPETVLARSTSARLMGRLATQHIRRGPDGELLPSTINKPTPDQLTPVQRSKDLAQARRSQKQLQRQARTDSTRATFGLGYGVGQRAIIRTNLARRQMTKDLKARYASGEITAQQYHNEKHMAKSESVTVPVRAERREVRRERLHGTYLLAQAGGLSALRNSEAAEARKQKTTAKKTGKAMAKLHGTALKINNARDERLRVEQELQRRNLLPEDD